MRKIMQMPLRIPGSAVDSVFTLNTMEIYCNYRLT